MQLLIEEARAGIQVHPAQVLTSVLGQPASSPPASQPTTLDPSIPSTLKCPAFPEAVVLTIPGFCTSGARCLRVRDSSLPVHIVLVLHNAAGAPSPKGPCRPDGSLDSLYRVFLSLSVGLSHLPVCLGAPEGQRLCLWLTATSPGT